MLFFRFISYICIPICFFAHRPALLSDEDKKNGLTIGSKPVGELTVKIQHWPEIKGHRVYPIWIILFVLLVTNFSTVTGAGSKMFLSFWHFISSKESLTFYAVGFILFISIAGYEKIKESETWGLFKEFLKAKKQKICPIVEIVDDEENDE